MMTHQQLELPYDEDAQAWNHAFYWKCLSPHGSNTPAPKLSKHLARHFGSAAGFRTAFTQAAESASGFAWIWLVQDRDGALGILTTASSGNPLGSGYIPLLACDVWEHAHDLFRGDKRAEYLNAFWNMVNWDFVAENCLFPASVTAGHGSGQSKSGSRSSGNSQSA